MKITPSSHIYKCAGDPEVSEIEPASGICATCSIDISEGVHISKIENPAFSQNADFLRFGTHVCRACAWLYWSGKGKPGNFLAASNKFKQLVISHESVVEDKEPWCFALQQISGLPADTVVCGVLTTDVKPRLWPRARLATVGNFGLYVHAPDYDISTFIEFDLSKCLKISRLMKEPLISGFSKSSIYHGLFSDFSRSSRDIERSAAMESFLSVNRKDPAFIPALLISGVTKEEKKDVRTQSANRTAIAPTKSSNQPNKTQLSLF